MKRFSMVWLSLLFLSATGSADDWPQWRGPTRDGVWRETGLIDQFESDQIEARWKMPIGSGYAGPTVAKGRVFVSDRLVEPTQVERVHCFDAKSGVNLWTLAYECDYTVSYSAGPRACITIDDNRAFALGAMGHLHCLDVGTGDVLWKKDLNELYEIRMPIWGIAGAPLIHDDLVIIQAGGKEACIVALEKKSGEEAWTSLKNDRASYSAPILVKQNERDVAVCWTGDSVSGLNPKTGEIHWRFPFPPSRMPIGIATPIVSKNKLFVTSFYDGSLMLRLAAGEMAVEKVWQRVGPNEKQTEALQSIISTPIYLGDHIYGMDSYGELRCLDASNGDRIWEDQTATPRVRWGNVHFVRNADRVWMFNEVGELIIAKLSPRGFDEISRAKLILPTKVQLRRGDGVCWAHPAFADRHVFIRNDEELVCASLEAK